MLLARVGQPHEIVLMRGRVSEKTSYWQVSPGPLGYDPRYRTCPYFPIILFGLF